jgi:diguanylate cyclase (GGDEF)-like protein
MLLDFSREGGFIGVLGGPLPAGVRPGDAVRVVVTPGSDAITLEGEVRHTGVSGMGISFSSLDDVTLRWLERATVQKTVPDRSPSRDRQFSDDVRRRVIHRCVDTALSYYQDHLVRAVVRLPDAMFSPGDVMVSGMNPAQVRDALASMVNRSDAFIRSITSEMTTLIRARLPEHPVSGSDTAVVEPVFTSDTLSLVDKDEFEDWLKAKVAVSKAEVALKETMTELETRIEYLFFRGSDKVENPFAPTLLSEQVHRSLRMFGLPRPLETLAFKRILDQLLAAYDGFCASLNEHFIDEGVLPPGDIGRYLVKRLARMQQAEAKPKRDAAGNPVEAAASAGSPASPADPQSAAQTAGDPQSDARVAGPVSQGYSAVNDLFRLGKGLAGEAAAPLPDGGRPVSEEDIRRALLHLAREQSFDPAGEGSDGASLLAAIESRLPDPSHMVMGPVRDTLEITSSLIGSIANQQKMTGEARRQFCRIQLPLAALQMSDPGVFQSEEHPARELVNYLAMLAEPTSMNSEANTDTIRRVVDSLAQTEKVDGHVIRDLVDDIKSQIDREKRIIDRNIHRVIEVCEGQQRVVKATTILEEELARRLYGRPVPVLLTELLDSGWRELMRLTLIREGAESRPWTTSLQVLDDVVRLCTERPLDRAALRFPVDDLVRVIEKGLQKVPNPKVNVAALLDRIRQAPARPAASGDELVVLEAPVVDTSMEEHSHDKWYRRAQRIEEGQWVEYGIGTGQERLCQMIWASVDRTRFTFVNQQGLRIAELSARELADRLKSGEIAVLGEGGDSAIEKGFDALIQRLYAKVARDISRDQLTGLGNRKEFEHNLAQCVARAKSHEQTFALIYFDIVGFNIINTTCGHEGGDEMLKDFARHLSDLVPDASAIGRIGGNEFAVIVPTGDEALGFNRATQLRRSIESRRFQWNGQDFGIGVTMAMCTFNHEAQQVLEYLNLVESGVQIAKSTASREIQWIRPGDSKLEHRSQIMSWVGRITAALDRNQLRLRVQKIQPIVEIHAHLLPHYEILLSILDENGEQIPPGDFIRAAEEYGQMALVDRWVIREAFGWINEHRDFMNQIGGFTVNLSGHSLNDENFLNYAFEQLVRFDVPRDKLIFEVTETTAVANLEEAADFINQMRDIGCRFSLDDFGAGQSSYAYLKHLPVDIIKIDGSFIKNIESNLTDYALVKSITDMGHFLKKKIVAEFVSDQTKYDLCRELGVDYVQGYHIAKPVLIDEILKDYHPILSDAPETV